MPKDKLISYNDDLYYQGRSITKIPNKTDINRYDTSTLVYFKQTSSVSINGQADFTQKLKHKQYGLVYNLHQNIKPIYFTITNISCTGTVRSSTNYNNVFINFGAINGGVVFPIFNNVIVASTREADVDVNVNSGYPKDAVCIYNIYDTYFLQYNIDDATVAFNRFCYYLPMIYVLLTDQTHSVITSNFVLSYTLSICGTTIA